MTEQDKIRKAVEQFNEWITSDFGEVKNRRKMDNAVKSLISLAQQYLAVKMPEEKDEKDKGE